MSLLRFGYQFEPQYGSQYGSQYEYATFSPASGKGMNISPRQPLLTRVKGAEPRNR